MLNTNKYRFVNLSFALIFTTLCFAQKPEELFKQGKDFFSIGNFELALNKFDSALKLSPQQSDIYFYAGLASYNLKNYKNASKYFSKEIKYSKKNSKGYIYRAKANQGIYRKANRDLNRARKLQADSFLICHEKANLLYAHKKYKKAIKWYSKLLQLRPGFEEAYYKLGFCKFNLNDKEEACAYWKKIEELDDFENFETIEKNCNCSTN